ncbi:hypothetical protein FW774_07575 [Pedobacter sp. BS3]|uniref:hypothetical protein n=1 Tax=Pedobacter sp. BS3 TaxID=2567937 RepID=UPI0011F09874|nr:hypothetical protein [Pedobacter sp. BS3]TZF84829.1 hypothetical protein FW774_07575 [Pedobacter sp. BS3]
MQRLNYLALAIVFYITSCNQNTPHSGKQTDEQHQQTAVTDSDKLIIPGKKIGKITLGMDASGLEKLLGKPDLSDAAMGKAWLTWLSDSSARNPNELNIYTTYSDSTMSNKVVKQIRITSHDFTTPTGIHTGVQYKLLTTYSLQKLATYQDIAVYDDIKEGIAFETGQDSIVHSIIIHQPGTKVTDVYSYLHPEMKIVK